MPNNGRLSEPWLEHRFVSFDETVIFFRRHLLEVSSRATLLILHGMGEHGGRYRPLAEALGALGIESIVPDLRGFGQSGGKRGCLRRFRDYFQDLNAIEHLAKQGASNRPFFVLGHSFGGLIAASWLAEEAKNKARGLLLTSPNFGIAIHVPAWRHGLAVAASCLTPDYTQDNRVDSDFLTHDRTVFEQYKLDRFNHHRISARLYCEMARQLARKEEIASQLTLPTLVLQAGDDRIVSQKDTQLFFERLASKDKQLEVLPGLYHEVLNETGRAGIYAKIGGWILQRI